MRSNLSSWRWLCLLIGAVFMLLLAGCLARPRAVYVETGVPVGIAAYPHSYYDGRPVYWAHGHWYYRHGSRWAYYNDPPPMLRHQHVHVERAPRSYSTRYSTRHSRERVVVAPRARRAR